MYHLDNYLKIFFRKNYKIFLALLDLKLLLLVAKKFIKITCNIFFCMFTSKMQNNSWKTISKTFFKA